MPTMVIPHLISNLQLTSNLVFYTSYSVFTMFEKGRGGGRGGGGAGNVKSFDIYIQQISTIPKRPRVAKQYRHPEVLNFISPML